VADREQSTDENSGRRKSLSAEDRWPELPDDSAFDEALVAAVLAAVPPTSQQPPKGAHNRVVWRTNHFRN